MQNDPNTEDLVNWIHFDGRDAVDKASKWIHKQTGWPEKSVRFFLWNYGMYKGYSEGFEILRATMFDTHAKGVEVHYDPNFIDIEKK